MNGQSAGDGPEQAPAPAEAFSPISAEVEDLASAVVEGAFRVHRALGPGLLESAYEVCLCHELTKMGIDFERQVPLPVDYDGVSIQTGLRLDLWVARRIVMELKAVEDVSDLHRAQLLTYLKLTGGRLGFIINFNVAKLKDGIERMIL